MLELLDGDVAKVYDEQGLADYRPRFSPVVRALLAEGPLSIRALALAVGVTHSAASQTVNQMARAGFVALTRGADARQRIVRLTERTRELLPVIEAEWDATEAAMAELDQELSVPLAQVLAEIESALEKRSFAARIAGNVQDRPDQD
ncbi:MarR family winged helix-turn-helix transcriptional regulator [Kribbella deserti]|uniref:MarR family winged helix-turn-helix transcriptional regulator n=1 Tax=Kribbella deserti TaxID=1926257 RepID=UPI0036D3F804